MENAIGSSGTIAGSCKRRQRHAPAELPEYVEGDEYRLEQVLKNLVGNAVKFTEKGSVKVRVEKLDGDEWMFSVRDDGIGIPKEKIPMLFDKFYQADSSYAKRYSGAGLDLAISKQLVELMGGEIRVDSEHGKGSVFSFAVVLPVRGAANTESRANSETKKETGA